MAAGTGPTRPGETINPATGQGVASPEGPPARRTGDTLEGALADLGLDVGARRAPGSAADPDEPPVFMGQTRRKGMNRVGKPTYKQRVLPLSEAYAEFYSFDTKTLRDLQETAYRAGYYGNVDREDVRWGDHDEESFSIWQAMVQRSAGFYSQGKRVSPFEALRRSVGSAPPRPEDEEPEKQRRAPLVTVLSNPDDLREVLQAGARTVLGRKLGDDEVAAFIASRQGQERRIQAQEYAMGGDEFVGNDENAPGGEITQLVDPRTEAEMAAREADPLKADSRKVVQQFESLVKMLGAGGILQSGAPEQ